MEMFSHLVNKTIGDWQNIPLWVVLVFPQCAQPSKLDSKQFSFTKRVREGTTSILEREYQPAVTAAVAPVFGGSYCWRLT